MKKRITWVLTLPLFFTIQSCEEGRFEKKISSHGDNESHNSGQNCMACHTKGGDGEGWFEAAGTVYDPSFASTYPNTLVRLYTGPNGTGDLKYTIEGDAKGNFYTTKNVKFKTNLYPSVTGSGATKYMSSAISTGNCMSCHGNTTDKIWTE